MDELLERIEEALADPEFGSKAAKIRDVEAFKALFAERGIELSDEVAQGAIDKMVSIENGEELSAEDLDLVAGGGLGKKLSGHALIWGCTAAGAALGGPGGAVVGGVFGTYLACKYC